ncbi:putative Aldehyde reductase [Seiridium unicorne]|uniref:Aldehyde reductase n=1 Tax=Seiridium unicorne TaxID=138068 RepID=A0ABR2UM85_9PEZI
MVGKLSWAQIAVQFDPIGTVLLVASLVCFILAMQYGGVFKAWNSAGVIGLLAVWFVMSIAFAINEWYQGDKALVVYRIMRDRTMATFDATTVTFLTVVVVGKIGIYQPFLIAGAILQTLGVGLSYTFGLTTSLGLTIGYQIIYGTGTGLGIQNAIIVGQTLSSPDDMSMTMATIIFFQFSAGAYGVSSTNSVLDNILIKKLAQCLPDLNAQDVLKVGATGINSVYGVATLNPVRQAFLDGTYHYDMVNLPTTQPAKLVIGCSPFFAADRDSHEKWLDVLQEVGIDTIDAAQSYGETEANLGKLNASSRFTIDTKVSTSLGDGPPTTKDVVNIYYLHSPDRRVPIEDTLEGVNELYKEGAFKHFGISNYLPHEIEEIVRITKERNWVRPSVYQGNYSAVARRPDTELLPILRKHGIAFYAYSPIAGGFLAKTKDTLTSTDRWKPESFLGKMYLGMYGKPSYLEALEKWSQIAKEAGISQTELAFRWIVHNPSLRGDLGDAVIIGARTTDHIREIVNGIKKGPLSSGATKYIDEIWETIKADAPLNNVGGL